MLRTVFGHFPTGVPVVTCLGPNGPRGLTVNSLCSVSLRPPLVLTCLDTGARTVPVIRANGRFAINLLSGDQVKALPWCSTAGATGRSRPTTPIGSLAADPVSLTAR